MCGLEAGKPLSARNGIVVIPPYGMEGLLGADLVAVPATRLRNYPPDVLDALRKAAAGGATVLSVCSGVFVLGAAGLLDGRPCTAHWHDVEELAERYPEAKINPDVLFVDDGDLITSAGTAAGIDACLHLVRRELGSAVATLIARRMVVPPQRDGGAETVCRPAGAGVLGGQPSAGADLDAGEHHGRASGLVVGAAGRHVGSHVRSQVRCGDWNDPAQVAFPATRAACTDPVGAD